MFILKDLWYIFLIQLLTKVLINLQRFALLYEQSSYIIDESLLHACCVFTSKQ